MILGFLSALGIGVNLANDYRRHNRKILGTDRDIFKDNPMFQENERVCNEIIARQRMEYEKRTRKKANW